MTNAWKSSLTSCRWQNMGLGGMLGGKDSSIMSPSALKLHQGHVSRLFLRGRAV